MNPGVAALSRLREPPIPRRGRRGESSGISPTLPWLGSPGSRRRYAPHLDVGEVDEDDAVPLAALCDVVTEHLVASIFHGLSEVLGMSCWALLDETLRRLR